MRPDARAVYGDPGSLAAAVAGLDDLAAELLLATAGQGRATAGVLSCWHGEAADAFLAAQTARTRDVSTLLDAVRAARSALEVLGQELRAARVALRRVTEAAQASGLRVRDDARAVYLPADFGLLHPDALGAPEQAERLTAQLTAIWWAAQEAWAAALARLQAVHPQPMASQTSLVRRVGGYAWTEAPGIVGGIWLTPMTMARALAERDAAAAQRWARKQRLPRLGTVAAASGEGLALLRRIPGLRSVTVLGGGLSVWAIFSDIRGGTPPAVAVLANGSSAGASAAAGAAALALAQATPPGRAVAVAGMVAMGVGSVVHWALETEPVKRAMSGFTSAVSSRFQQLARDEREMMERLARAS